MHMEIVELSDNSEYLDKFYELYRTMFSNDDEIDSKENLRKCLSLKNSNFYGNNAYHIFCLKDKGYIAGFIIGDYYSDQNSGVIEFVVVKSEYRGKGLAKNLIEYFMAKIKKDAGKDIDGIYCEVDVKSLSDYKNPDLTSLIFLRNLGFSVVEINYIRPASDHSKKPVTDPVLMYRDLKGDGLNVDSLRTFIKSYMKYAMSIEIPEEKEEFKLIEKHLNGRTKVALLPVDEYIKVGMNYFNDPAIDYIATFPVIPFNESIEDFKDLSQSGAAELGGTIKKKLESFPFFDSVSIEVQKGNGNPIDDNGKNDKFILKMRGKREKYFSGDYLKSKFSIKGVLELKDNILFSSNLPLGSATPSKVQIWIDIDHLGMASMHFIVYYDGFYSTREIISLTDANTVSVFDGESNKSLPVFAGKIAAILQSLKDKSSGSNINLELYPLSFLNTYSHFRDIKAHVYAIVNQDTSYEYANIRYIKKFFYEDQSVLDTVYAHYGIRSGVIIFSEDKPGLFLAVTGYDISEIEADNPEEFKDKVRITILNEYISEVTSLLHERLYLKRLENTLSRSDLSPTNNEKKKLKYLTELQSRFYTELEEFRGLSLYSYPELDFALKQARSDMGITEELDTMINSIESLSKKTELLYHIRNDFHTVLLSYLLTLFTAATFTVAITNLIFPSASIFIKVLLIFMLPATAIIVLYVFSIKHRV